MAESRSDSHNAKLIAAISTVLVALATASSAPWWWPTQEEPPAASVTSEPEEASAVLGTPAAPDPMRAVSPAGPASSTLPPPPAAPPREPPSVESPATDGRLYTARLGARDHCNSRGEPLGSAGMVVRQDRANQAISRATDPGDQRDGRFTSKQARAELVRNLRIAPDDRRVITERMPQIAVYEEAGAYRVRVLDPGDVLVACR